MSLVQYSYAYYHVEVSFISFSMIPKCGVKLVGTFVCQMCVNFETKLGILFKLTTLLFKSYMFLSSP